MKILNEFRNMITEDYVSFETAKLLKEKGFDKKCFTVYNNNHEYRSSDYFDSYEEACEAGIKYYLENLI